MKIEMTLPYEEKDSPTCTKKTYLTRAEIYIGVETRKM
jgi:hypothetical protein